MITLGIDVSPGEVAYFHVGGRDYALACAAEGIGQPHDTPRALNRARGGREDVCRASWPGARGLQTRQLALRDPARQIPAALPDGITIANEDGCLVAYDGEEILGYANDAETLRRQIIEPYLAELHRQTRSLDQRDHLRKNRL